MTQIYQLMRSALSLASWRQVVAASFLLLVSYLALHILYNVFLHPLRRFPGPKLWAATRIPWCWYQYNGILSKKLLELHIKYGSTLRVAPNELSFTSDTALKTIYGHRSAEMGKDPIFSLLTPSGVQNILTADRETHIRQRRLLSHAFSEKSLREQESILQGYVDKFLTQLSSRFQAEPFNIASWFNFTTFDLIGDMSFGENFGNLENGDYDPVSGSVKQISKELTMMQMFKYWKIASIRQFFLPKGVQGARQANFKRAMAMVERRVQNDTDKKDFLHYILAANDEKGMSRDEINVNVFSLNIAGSESTATAMSGAVFFMLTNPEIYQRVVNEVRTRYKTKDEITLVSLNDLVYLDAVMTEVLRLYPPVSGTLPRVVPFNGETIDGRFVPAGTTVGVNHYSTSRHPENFSRADEFLPERWLVDAEPEFLNDKKACAQPFSHGPRNCLGKNLAKAEMRLILAKLLWTYDLSLEPGQEDWIGVQTVFGFWVKPELMCTITRVSR